MARRRERDDPVIALPSAPLPSVAFVAPTHRPATPHHAVSPVATPAGPGHYDPSYGNHNWNGTGSTGSLATTGEAPNSGNGPVPAGRRGPVRPPVVPPGVVTPPPTVSPGPVTPPVTPTSPSGRRTTAMPMGLHLNYNPPRVDGRRVENTQNRTNAESSRDVRDTQNHTTKESSHAKVRENVVCNRPPDNSPKKGGGGGKASFIPWEKKGKKC